MRKLMIVGVLVATSLAGAVGCADNSPAPTGDQNQASTPGGDSAGDQTAEVCVEAIKVSKDNSNTLEAKSREAATALRSNDTAKVTQLGQEVTQLSAAWKAKLQELSMKKIDPDVKSALVNGVSVVTSMADTSKPTTADQIRTKLQVFQTQLTAACDKS